MQFPEEIMLEPGKEMLAGNAQEASYTTAVILAV